MRISDWSSDVCSSDLLQNRRHLEVGDGREQMFERGRNALCRIGEDRRIGHAERRNEHQPERNERRIDLAAGEADVAVTVADRHDRKRSEEHTSELQSLMRISYAVFCLKKKT